MRTTERIVAVALAATGATVAIGRLRALASLSPPDLAFFHQATWNATRGNGLYRRHSSSTQPFSSIHPSLIRAVRVPI